MHSPYVETYYNIECSINFSKGAAQNICITHRFLFQGEDVMVEELVKLLVRVVDAKLEKNFKNFLYNLRMDQISQNVCSWKAFPA
jgi:hypothetical protein